MIKQAAWLLVRCVAIQTTQRWLAVIELGQTIIVRQDEWASLQAKKNGVFFKQLWLHARQI